MNQNQCVPSWGIQDFTPPDPLVASRVRSHSDISLQDYEVTELTWENGQLTMHGLGLPRVSPKSNPASDTLEAIVSHAGKNPPPPGGGASINIDNLVPLFDGQPYSALVPLFDGQPNSAPRNTALPSVSMSMDALVPNANNGGCSTRVGSCSVAVARVPAGSEWSMSAWDSERINTGDTRQQMSGGLNGMTSTSFELSLDNAKTVVTAGDEHDSVCHSRPQKGKRAREEDNVNKRNCKISGSGFGSGSAQRSRAAAIHNQSERKRRDKINERMKTLQKMVPNSNKTDKSSMLDEVIDYLKQLQAQIQMMTKIMMSMTSSMMMPMPMSIQQQLQMSMMSQMGTGMGTGLGTGMGMGMPGMSMGMDHMNNMIMNANDHAVSVNRQQLSWDAISGAFNVGDHHPVPSYQPTMLHSDPLSAYYLACQQSQSMSTVEAYSKMAAMYQQLQPPPPNSTSNN